MVDFFTTCNPFLIIGILWFLFYGLKAADIFSDGKDGLFSKELGTGKLKHSIFWIIYQFLFNGIGALTGWLAIYLLWNIPSDNFTFQHILLLLIAFAGITGNLPRIIYYGLWGK